MSWCWIYGQIQHAWFFFLNPSLLWPQPSQTNLKSSPVQQSPLSLRLHPLAYWGIAYALAFRCWQMPENIFKVLFSHEPSSCFKSTPGNLKMCFTVINWTLSLLLTFCQSQPVGWGLNDTWIFVLAAWVQALTSYWSACGMLWSSTQAGTTWPNSATN